MQRCCNLWAGTIMDNSLAPIAAPATVRGGGLDVEVAAEPGGDGFGDALPPAGLDDLAVAGFGPVNGRLGDVGRSGHAGMDSRSCSISTSITRAIGIATTSVDSADDTAPCNVELDRRAGTVAFRVDSRGRNRSPRDRLARPAPALCSGHTPGHPTRYAHHHSGAPHADTPHARLATSRNPPLTKREASLPDAPARRRSRAPR